VIARISPHGTSKVPGLSLLMRIPLANEETAVRGKNSTSCKRVSESKHKAYYKAESKPMQEI
jgi:hypothetical protein